MHPSILAAQTRCRGAYIGLTLGVVLISGCSREETPALVGHWKADDGKASMEFKADGTCEGIDTYARVVKGHYSMPDTDHLHLKLSIRATNAQSGTIVADNAEGTVRMHLQGDALLLTEGGGVVTRYKRGK